MAVEEQILETLHTLPPAQRAREKSAPLLHFYVF
jgi:hypothetical protein